MEKRPLLFTKTGIINSAPDDFVFRLAEAFEAEVHETNSIIEALTGHPYAAAASTRHEARRIALERSVATLQLGRNAIYDAFINSEKIRDELRAQARLVGGQTLILCLDTPLEVANARLAARYPVGSPELAKVIDTAASMERHIDWPLANDGDVIYLDGRLPTDQLLAQIRRKVDSGDFKPKRRIKKSKPGHLYY